MFMMSARTVVRGLAMSGLDPGAGLAEANDSLAEDNDLATFVTMVFGTFDSSDGTVTYANAGHDAPLLFGEGDCVEHDGTRGVALGLLLGQSCSTSWIELRQGQGICLFTDGVTEAENPNGEMFGADGVRRVPSDAAVSGLDAEAVVEQVVNAVQEFAQGHDQSADITCLSVIRRRRDGIFG